MPENSLRFLLNGDIVEVTTAPAQTTLLEYLRDERRRNSVAAMSDDMES